MDTLLGLRTNFQGRIAKPLDFLPRLGIKEMVLNPDLPKNLVLNPDLPARNWS